LVPKPTNTSPLLFPLKPLSSSIIPFPFHFLFSILNHLRFCLARVYAFLLISIFHQLGNQNGGTRSGFLLCYRFLLHRWSRRFGDSSHL
jgi:hypothetical protein